MSVRLGFVGGGFIAEFHGRALEFVRGGEVAGLTSRTPPTTLAERFRAAGLGEAVVYEPVEIEPRVLVPRVIRDDSRYNTDDIDRAADEAAGQA